MGTGEEGTPAKPSKPASSTQEIPTTPAYHDWSSSMQAYYGAGGAPPPFFASTVASPSPHPYIWGGQHSLITPYGTPVPYPALYPGGVYAHPNMTMTPNPLQANPEPEGKGADGKDGNLTKASKGTVGGRTGESGKATSGSGNDGASQSNAESGSEGSSETNDENNNRQEFGANKKGSFDQMLADANAQNSIRNTQVSEPGKSVSSMPATNLNIGMDYWNPSSTATGAAKVMPNPSGASAAVAPISSVMPENWIQDERELKRQKRKQSNRESARRSRLRKQAECEELQARVEKLNNDNRDLKDELKRLSEECEKLASENSGIKEELMRLCGPEALENLEKSNNTSHTQSHGDEGNS